MPPKATRGSQKKQTKGRKRSGDQEINQRTAESTASQLSADSAAAAMSDDGDEETQSSSDAAATPLSKKAKLKAAAAAASSFVASVFVFPLFSAFAPAASVASASSTAAAATATSSPTPCARLDPDSLSVVFSFLNMRDFLNAVRVSRHWRTARVKKSAWPAPNLQSMIQLLRDDDFDNPQRRKLEVAVKPGDQKKLGALLSRPGAMELWRHVTEIRLVHEKLDWRGLEDKQVAASSEMLQALPQFASLSALTLDGFTLAEGDDETPKALFDALSARLLTLGLVNCSRAFESQLHRLGSLRVLVLCWIPPADALLPLHQLVYLHIELKAFAR